MRRYTLSIVSQIFQMLLVQPAMGYAGGGHRPHWQTVTTCGDRCRHTVAAGGVSYVAAPGYVIAYGVH